MGDKTGIEWTDATWNPVTGCRKVSAGCANCYAERVFPRAYAGQTVLLDQDMETGEYDSRPRRFTDVRCHPERLDQPLRWRKPRRVFVNSMSDLFHEDVPDHFIAQVFAVMALAPRNTFQVLTKRPERMLGLLTDERWRLTFHATQARSLRLVDDTGLMLRWPLPNVWLGVSVEDQATADQRIPLLLDTPAAVRFVSYEPALGPVDFRGYLHAIPEDERDGTGPVTWVIVGGESGPKARPFDIRWAEQTIEQCRLAGVPVFVKQLGARPYDNGIEPAGRWWPPGVSRQWEYGDVVNERGGYLRSIHLKHRAGGDWSEWPEHLRVREYPQEADRG